MNSEPKPLIEEHYHIRELIERQQKRTEDREYFRNREKEKEERLNDIKSAPDEQLMEFWCEVCQEDFRMIGKKVFQSNFGELVAYYRTKHKCGMNCIRHITDKYRDKYFFQSRKVKKDQVDNFNNVIQPFQTGHNMLYGKK